MSTKQRTSPAVERGLANTNTITGLRPLPVDPILGRCLGGKLIVEERIGAGTLGSVYRAKHVLLPQPVAVKVLHADYQEDPDFRARFLAEAQAASVLDHPSLVRVLDFGEQWGGFMWLAMELLEGERLDTILEEEGRFSVEDAVEILLDVCAGLAHAHGRGIVHGDVKPANILLVSRADDDGDSVRRAKLCEFGVARMSMHGDVVESGTRPALGTPAYMSPEQCLGEALDARSDVYSCGVLLYELLTGEVPFDGREPHVLLRQHLLMPPALPSAKHADVDARVDAIVTRALAKDPRDRFGSMRELRAALRELLGGLGRAPRVTSVPPPAPPARVSGRAPSKTMFFPPPVFPSERPSEPAPTAAPPVDAVPVGRAALPGGAFALAFAFTEPLPPVPPAPDTDVEIDLCNASERDEAPRSLTKACDHADFLLARAELLEREKHALTELLMRGSADAVAWRVARLILREESSRGRDTVAVETLRLLDSPANLGPFSERLLSEDVLPGPYIERVLRRAGHAGARALWSARIVPGVASPERRGRFVSWMLAIGLGARDVLRAGLNKLGAHVESGRHADIVEDVLLALPVRCEDDLLAVVARFAKSPVPRVRELALAAVARALG